MPPKTPRSVVQKKKSKKELKAEAAAKLAEQKRLEEEARIAEELRLKEKDRLELERKLGLDTPEGRLRDVLKWFDSLPLSRKCSKRIDRELSDGVLIAELISLFHPDACDKRFVYTFYSSINKNANWEYLNNKVFPELGFHLKPATISNLIQPFKCGKFENSCAHELQIYELLTKLHKKLSEEWETENPTFFDYRQNSQNPEQSKIECPKVVKSMVNKRRPMTPDKPMFSKIEVQIANGLFDEEDKDTNVNSKGSFDTYDDTCDWVNVMIPGGQIVFEANDCNPIRLSALLDCPLLSGAS